MVISMDIKQLQYFLTICEEGQITAAAKRLHMAQPPLSYQLKMLEEELGVELLKRGRHHIQLTDAGELLKEKAEHILRLCDATKKEVQDASHGVHHQLSIGIVPSSHHAFLESGIQLFHQEYPNVDFSLKEGNTFQVLEMLEKGLIDLGIVRTPFPQSKVHACTFWKEGMAAVTRKDEQILKKEAVTLRDLKELPLIYYERYASLLNELFLEEGFLPHIFCMNQDARTTLLWAKAGLGVAIVPKSAISLIDAQDLSIHDIIDQRLQTEIVMITLRDHYITDITEKFISYYQK